MRPTCHTLPGHLMPMTTHHRAGCPCQARIYRLSESIAKKMSLVVIFYAPIWSDGRSCRILERHEQVTGGVGWNFRRTPACLTPVRFEANYFVPQLSAMKSSRRFSKTDIGHPAKYRASKQKTWWLFIWQNLFCRSLRINLSRPFPLRSRHRVTQGYAALKSQF